MAVTARQDRGAWWVFAVSQGRRTKRRIGVGPAAKAAAQSVAKTVSAQIALEDFSFFDRRADSAGTVREYAEGWLATVRGRLSGGTAESYETVLRLHWLPTIGDTTLTALRRDTIKGVIARWLAAGAASGTVRKQWSILRACLGQAVDDGRLPANPAARLGKWAGRSKDRAKAIEVFSPDETRALLDATITEAPYVQPLVMVLARTGLRIGEALTLQWADVDLEARQIVVRRTWSGARKVKAMNAPKGNRERTVDVSRQCAAVLRMHRLRGLGRWVFAGADGEPIVARRFGHVWNAVVTTAGIPYRKVHTLRHTYATRLIEQGESLAYVQQQLGHASIQITVDLYGHLAPGGNRAAVDRLDDADVAVASGRAGHGS